MSGNMEDQKSVVETDSDVELKTIPHVSKETEENVGAIAEADVKLSTTELQMSSSEIGASTGKNNSNNESNKDESYPDAFYCPLTHEVFQDPVVTSDGISYERSILEARGTEASTLYSNRALKSIIDEALEHKNSSGFKKLQRSVRQFSQQFANEYHRPLPDGYYCPITLALIHAPVIDPEGYSYEKAAIENWIRCNGASPVTRRPLTLEELLPNRNLAALMDEEKAKGEDSMHPTFKQWKEEPVPVLGTHGADLEVGGSVHRTVTLGTNVAAFPSTPEELEEVNRLRRSRRYQRCLLWLILFVLIGITAWMVPVVSTILLVLILAGVAIVTGYSSNSSTFRGNY